MPVRANSGLVQEVRYTPGTLVRFRRAGLSVQLSGTKSFKLTGTGTSALARITDICRRGLAA
jgi:hypothetical protein